MQTTHKVPGSSAVRFAKYLLSEAARGDHYYTHDGDNDAPTQWHGPEKLLRSFGIDPEKPVELRHLGPLDAGLQPGHREADPPGWIERHEDRRVSTSATPRRRKSRRCGRPPTLTAVPRSRPPTARRSKSTVERIEREVAWCAARSNKVQRFEKAKGLLATEVVHTTSRLGKDQDEHGIPDPQLHSHIMLLAAERKDGVLAAIESKQLYRSARENGAWYRAQLAANLQELGIGIERHQGNGERYFGVRGVSKELSERWSKRGQESTEPPIPSGAVTAASPALASSTPSPSPPAGPRPPRPRRQSTPPGARSARSTTRPANARRKPSTTGDLHRDPDVDLAKELLENVTRESSMINRHELQAKAYELSAGVCRPEEADRLIVELQRSGELLCLEDGTYTTKRLRELERETIAGRSAARRRHCRPRHRSSPRASAPAEGPRAEGCPQSGAARSARDDHRTRRRRDPRGAGRDGEGSRALRRHRCLAERRL